MMPEEDREEESSGIISKAKKMQLPEQVRTIGIPTDVPVSPHQSYHQPIEQNPFRA